MKSILSSNIEVDHFFRKMLEICASENEQILLDQIKHLKGELDYRYRADDDLIVLLSYCESLVLSKEYYELRKILTGKINKSSCKANKKSNIISLDSYKKSNVMTNDNEQYLNKKALRAEKAANLTEEKKKFLLTNESVLETIIAGLIKDFRCI